MQDSFMSKSPIHKLNPTLKFVSFVFIIVMIFLPLGFFSQIILLTILLAIFFAAKLKLKTLWSIIKSVIFLFVILFIINWFLYKTPLVSLVNNWSAFTGHNGILFGKTTWLDTNFLAFNNNGVLISQIWGGQVGINHSSILDPYNTSLIEEIIKQNNISADTITHYWNSKGAKNEVINKVLTPLFADESLKQKYFYLINNNFNYNNVLFKPIAIESVITNDLIYSLPQSLNADQAKIFLTQTMYLYSSNWYTLSPEAIQLALYVSVKVFLMIMAATILTSTTTSIELTYALENLLTPLKLFKLPVAEASMMIAIALRFIPSLIGESKRIMNAQASRGLDFNNGKITDKTKAIVSLVVPLFSIAFKKAEELANAMDARAYNPRYARTKYRKFLVRWFDWFGFFFLVLLFGFFIGITKWKLFFTPFNLFELGLIY